MECKLRKIHYDMMKFLAGFKENSQMFRMKKTFFQLLHCVFHQHTRTLFTDHLIYVHQNVPLQNDRNTINHAKRALEVTQNIRIRWSKEKKSQARRFT